MKTTITKIHKFQNPQTREAENPEIRDLACWTEIEAWMGVQGWGGAGGGGGGAQTFTETYNER